MRLIEAWLPIKTGTYYIALRAARGMVAFPALKHPMIDDRIFNIFLSNLANAANIAHFLFVKAFAVAYCGCTGQAVALYPMWT